MITLHLIWRTAAQHQNAEAGETRADNWLINSAYWALKDDRFSSAERILQYANKLRLSTESTQLMVLINLAQSLKWQGKEGECCRLLESRDWGANSILFKLCAAVLRGGAIEDLFVKAAIDGDLAPENVFEWPLFREFRKSARFSELMDKAFGPGTKPHAERFPPALFNAESETMFGQVFLGGHPKPAIDGHLKTGHHA